MTNPYRAMCAELVDIITAHANPDDAAVGYVAGILTRARALLAEPEAEGPTDEELMSLAVSVFEDWNATDKDYARAVLARWGLPAAAPAPEPGEVGELVADLQEIGEILCGMEKHRWAVKLTRAAALLQQQAAPVPVSERLPGPGDCDAEGRCWRYIDPEESMGNPMWELARSKYAGAAYGSVTWLPANALPTPEATNE